MIKNSKDWRFTGVFYDVESGLRLKGRTELDKMLKKAEKDKIDRGSDLEENGTYYLYVRAQNKVKGG